MNVATNPSMTEGKIDSDNFCALCHTLAVVNVPTADVSADLTLTNDNIITTVLLQQAYALTL